MTIQSIKRTLRAAGVGILSIILIGASGAAIASADTVSHTVSGTITTATGAPLVGASVVASDWFHSGTSCTDSNGHYSISMPASTYQLIVYASSNRGTNECGTYSPTPGTDDPSAINIMYQTPYTTLDLSNGDLTKDFTFATSKLTINVTDVNGNPITNTQTYSDFVDFPEAAVIPGGSSSPLGQTRVRPQNTDSNGQISGYVLTGTIIPAGGICSADRAGEGFCSTEAVTVNGDTTFNLREQLRAPSPLNVSSPTTLPQLNWGWVSSGSGYRIYRDGQLIGTTNGPTNTNYTDNSIPHSGTYSYYVTAVNASGQEGPQSPTATVIVDTSPVVTITSPSANSTVSGTTGINGTIYSQSNYNVQLYVFNSSNQAVVGKYQYAVPASTTNYSYSWDTTAVPNGNYTIILSAKDAQGHKDAGSTSTIHVTVNN